MNIRVDLNYPIKDGTEVVFRSPVDCSQITGLKVYYPDGSQEFVFADAHGNNVGNIDHLFAENVAVKVILDVTTGMAFVQNADTNAYLEGRFAELGESLLGEIGRVEQIAYEARGFAEQSPSAEYVNNEIARVEQMANDALNTASGLPTNEYVLDEIEKAVEESKSVIVTVSGSTPSHTSQQIYSAIQEGREVYLHQWGNTYNICSAATANEAKFENSYVDTITGADGKSYSRQKFRLYFIKNDKFSSQTIDVPSQSYVDAQIQYYLNK